MNIDNQIRISAKNLGQLALPNYCQRCFYLKLKLQFKLPYQIFPGIFSSIDSYSKKITWGYYDKFKKLPPWFNKLGNFSKPIKAPGRNQFYYIDQETNIKLTGVVDDIFLTTDNEYFIVDYKTAKFTPAQDSLLALYKAQLNSYALIAQNIGLRVAGVGLCYYEPVTEVNENNIESALLDDGFSMPFSAHCVELELEPVGVVKPLLKVVRELWEMDSSPKERRVWGL